MQDLVAAESYKDRMTMTANILMTTGLFSDQEDVKTTANTFYRLLVMGAKYRPDQRYTGDMCLIRAKDHTVDSATLDGSYNLQQVSI